MKTIFEEMGGTYRQVGDYFIPNITLPDDGEYQIGKYGRMRRSYLKEYRKILYNNYVLERTLFKHPFHSLPILHFCFSLCFCKHYAYSCTAGCKIQHLVCLRQRLWYNACKA